MARNYNSAEKLCGIARTTQNVLMIRILYARSVAAMLLCCISYGHC